MRPVPASQRAVSAAYDVGYRGDAAALNSNQRASYTASATLPVGVSAAFNAPPPGHVTSTLERDTKPTKGSKPLTAAQLAAGVDGEPHEKEKKKSRFSFFGGKSKKDKDSKK